MRREREKGGRGPQTIHTCKELRNNSLLHLSLGHLSLETDNINIIDEQDTRDTTLQRSHDSHVSHHMTSHMTTLASENRSRRELSDSPDTPLTISVAARRMRGRLIS